MKINLNRSTLFALAILSILTIAIFYQVLLNDFVNIDDHKLILDNEIINDPSVSIKEAFKWNVCEAHYKPLTFLSWRLEYALVGEKPFLYHFNNLLLHLANVLLVFFIGLKLLPQFFSDRNKIQIGALFFALLFASHPLHVESVAWATERKDVLFAFFFLAGWLAYLHYLGNKKYILMIIAAFLYLSSMLSKSTGITLIAVLFLTDYLYNRKLGLNLIFEKIPVILAFLTGAYLFGLLIDFSEEAQGLTFVASEGARSTYDILNEFPPLIRRIIKISFRFIMWIVHIFVPVKMALVYPKNELLNFFGKSLIAFPFIIIGLLVLTFLFRKKYKEAYWGFLFFGITISPAVSISETGLAVFLPDRYTYTPMIGFLLLFTVLAVKYFDEYRKTVYIIIGILTLFLSYQTFKQVKVWENTGTLWTNVLKYNNCHAEAYNTRANFYKEKGKVDLAFKDYNSAIECDKNLPQAYYGRALIYFSRKDFEKALSDFDQYISIKRNKVDEEAYVNRAAAYSSIGQNEKALVEIGKALEINPDYFSGYLNRAVILRDMNRYEEAIDDWSKCIEFQPNNFTYFKERGNSYYKLKKYNEALSDYTKAAEINPQNGSLYILKAYSLYMLRRIDEAKVEANKAKQLGSDPGERFWKALGVD